MESRYNQGSERSEHYQYQAPQGRFRPLFQMENVDVAIKGSKILKSISLDIAKGDFLFITGATGAGKTTLLKTLAGDLKDVKGFFHRHLQEGHRNLFIAEVFQDLKVFPNHTVRQNLFFSYDRSIYDSEDQFTKDMEDYCDLFGIADRLDQKLSQANGGLKQIVAIIRALLSQPDILLADEPTSSLDNKTAFKVFEVLNYLCVKKKMTIVWTTHNRDLVKNFNGKIIHLESGKITYTGRACFI